MSEVGLPDANGGIVFIVGVRDGVPRGARDGSAVPKLEMGIPTLPDDVGAEDRASKEGASLKVGMVGPMVSSTDGPNEAETDVTADAMAVARLEGELVAARPAAIEGAAVSSSAEGVALEAAPRVGSSLSFTVGRNKAEGRPIGAGVAVPPVPSASGDDDDDGEGVGSSPFLNMCGTPVPDVDSVDGVDDAVTAAVGAAAVGAAAVGTDVVTTARHSAAGPTGTQDPPHGLSHGGSPRHAVAAGDESKPRKAPGQGQQSAGYSVQSPPDLSMPMPIERRRRSTPTPSAWVR